MIALAKRKKYEKNISEKFFFIYKNKSFFY